MKYAVYTGSRNLYNDMSVAVKSLLINSDVDKVFLLIEDEKFPNYLPDCVEAINVRNQTYFNSMSPNMDTHFTYMSMMRAALAKVFPDIDTILSLDVDTIIDRDISDIWDLPLGDKYYFAATPEYDKTNKDYMYTNMGVTLYNLKKLREDGKCDEVIQTLNRKKYFLIEQEVFNLYCQGHIYPMPNEYNVNKFCVHPTKQPLSGEPRIIHYPAMKKWSDQPDYLKYERYPWKEIRKE